MVIERNKLQILKEEMQAIQVFLPVLLKKIVIIKMIFL